MATLTYDDFLMSSKWVECLEKIGALNPQVAEAINNFGIWEDLSPDGSYKFEKLLVWMPGNIQQIILRDRAIYDAISQMAEAYEAFCRG